MMKKMRYKSEKIKKRVIGIRLLSLFMALLLLSSCAGSGREEKKKTEEPPSQKAPLHIVSTIFPEYDWVRVLLGDQQGKVKYTNLFTRGIDLHSFQPTAKDMQEIADCDLFLYVGGESDAWVEDALKNQSNPNRKVICLMTLLSDQLKNEEHLEGMMAEEEEEDGASSDEHVWLSLKNAQKIIPEIAKTLEALSPDQAVIIQDHEKAYLDQLKTLDQAYEKMTETGKRKTILFGDRFPFLYLTKDYGLTAYAAFSGCSAETEASFETVSFLSKKIDEKGLPMVLTIEGGDQKLAKTIIENTRKKDQTIGQMNSMQSVRKEDVEKGISYLQLMEENLKVLEKALH